MRNDGKRGAIYTPGHPALDDDGGEPGRRRRRTACERRAFEAAAELIARLARRTDRAIRRGRAARRSGGLQLVEVFK